MKKKNKTREKKNCLKKIKKKFKKKNCLKSFIQKKKQEKVFNRFLNKKLFTLKQKNQGWFETKKYINKQK